MRFPDPEYAAFTQAVLFGVKRARGERVKTKQLSFLVVEDHDFQRDMVVQMLKEMQAKEVHAAADGRAALELLKQLRDGVDMQGAEVVFEPDS